MSKGTGVNTSTKFGFLTPRLEIPSTIFEGILRWEKTGCADKEAKNLRVTVNEMNIGTWKRKKGLVGPLLIRMATLNIIFISETYLCSIVAEIIIIPFSLM